MAAVTVSDSRITVHELVLDDAEAAYALTKYQKETGMSRPLLNLRTE